MCAWWLVTEGTLRYGTFGCALLLLECGVRRRGGWRCRIYAHGSHMDAMYLYRRRARMVCAGQVFTEAEPSQLLWQGSSAIAGSHHPPIIHYLLNRLRVA